MNKNKIYWDLATNSAINRWAMSPAEETYFPGEARIMPDAVDYRFINGWVETGDLPCRESLREHVAQRTVSLPKNLSFPEIYFGGEDNRVDFSTFRFRPTLIKRWLTCSLFSEQAQEVEFALETCGGVHIWQDGQKVVQLDHYQRNSPTNQSFTLKLPKGSCELIVFLEELHERDASCYFVLTLKKGDQLKTGLSLEVDEDEVKEIEKTLDGLRTNQVFYCNENLLIEADYKPTKATKVQLDTGSYPSETVTMNVLLDGMKMQEEVSFVVDQTFSSATLFNTQGLNAGCISLRFLVKTGPLTFSRSLGTTILPPAIDVTSLDLASRKALALETMLSHGKEEPARALAALALKQQPELASRLIERALLPIKERHDCADFWILPLLWMYKSYAYSQLEPALWDQIKHEVLNFRYWLDEPGNDVMWFWSENHVLCFHVAQYLAGSLFEDEIFPNSGKTGKQHKAQAHARLIRWFDSMDDHGLAEWNSAAYYPIDFLGLFTLMTNAEDDILVSRAKQLIDQIFVMVALHTTGSVCAGSQGRIYEKELLAGPATELGSIAAIAFGGKWYPGYDRVTALLAVSDYQPPQLCERLLSVPAGESIYSRYTQGLDHNAKITLWKSASLQLSTVSDYKTGQKGHQQHFLDVQTNAHPLARFWINHPGDLKVWGGSRPSYWAGNGVHPKVAQYKNIGFMIFDQRAFADVINFTHAFVPAPICDEFIEESHWLFARSGSGFVGIYSSQALQPLKHGLYAGYEWRAYSDHCAWLVISGEVEDHQDLASFREHCLAHAPEFREEDNQINLNYDNGTLALNYQSGIHLQGKPIPFAPLSPIPHLAFCDTELIPWQDLSS